MGTSLTNVTETIGLELDCHMPTGDLHVTTAASELAISFPRDERANIIHRQTVTLHTPQPHIDLNIESFRHHTYIHPLFHPTITSSFARHIMSSSALLRLIDTSCCGLRKSKTDKRSEERKIGETQGLLKHDDLDSEVESLDCAWAQGPLLQVEACDDWGMQVVDRIQDDGDVQGEGSLQEVRMIQDDGAVRGGQDNTELLVLEDDEERHNTEVQKLDSLDCTVSDSESIELKDPVQNALLSQDDLDFYSKVSHAVEVKTPITPPKTIIALEGLLENGLELTEHNAKQVLDPVNVGKPNKVGVSSASGNCSAA